MLNTTNVCSISENDTTQKGRRIDKAVAILHSNTEASNCNRKKKGKGNKDLLKEVYAVVRLKHTKNNEQLKAKVTELAQKYGSLRSVARRLGITWGQIQNMYRIRKYKKKVYVRKFDEETKEEIAKFYLEGPAVVSMPDAQHSGKVFLNRSLKEACNMFNASRVNKRKVAPNTFAAYRPKKRVKLQSKIPLYSSLCEIRVNYKLYAQALTGAGLKGILTEAKAAVRKTICSHEHLCKEDDEGKRTVGRYGFRKCLFRQCDRCGIQLLLNEVRQTNKHLIEENKNVHYH